MKTLDLYITRICNLDCEYCYVDIVKKEDNIFPVTDFLDRVNLLEYDDIKFFGWEPLTRFSLIQDIVESVSTKKKKVSFTIVTNGILLSEEKISYILKHNVNVVISIHEGSFPHLKSKIELLKKLWNKGGFYIIFDPHNFQTSLKNFLFFFSQGFKNFCFAPEIYSDWNEKNLHALQKLLEKITPSILKYHLNISGISHNYLKTPNRACEKTVYDETGSFRPCNRFKALRWKEKFNYKQVYDAFDEIISYNSDPLRWFYICPVWWYIDHNGGDVKESITRFKKLNHVFIHFFREIHKHHRSFLSQDIQEIRFNLTKQCNLRCEYCYVDFKNEVLSYSAATNIIDFYLEQLGEKIDFSFFGGEPLLEFELLEKLVAYICKKNTERKKEITFTIATNFTLISEKVIQFLRTHKFELHISFNGDKDENDASRDLSSEKVLRNIEKFLRDDEREKVCILFAFAPQSVENIYKNMNFLIQKWFRIFNLELIFWKEYSWKQEDIQKAVSYFQEILKKFPDIQYKNLDKKKVYLDIDTDGRCNENSLDFHAEWLNLNAKKVFDRLLLKWVPGENHREQ